jgi:hypothetical protein
MIRRTTSNQMVGACGAVGSTSVTAGVRTGTRAGTSDSHAWWQQLASHGTQLRTRRTVSNGTMRGRGKNHTALQQRVHHEGVHYTEVTRTREQSNL